MRNSSIRGYFSSSQGIADYAEVLLHVKEKFSLQNSPIIVIGGSYGGSKNLCFSFFLWSKHLLHVQFRLDFSVAFVL